MHRGLAEELVQHDAAAVQGLGDDARFLLQLPHCSCVDGLCVVGRLAAVCAPLADAKAALLQAQQHFVKLRSKRTIAATLLSQLLQVPHLNLLSTC